MIEIDGHVLIDPDEMKTIQEGGFESADEESLQYAKDLTEHLRRLPDDAAEHLGSGLIKATI